jgi:hypothetical protein
VVVVQCGKSSLVVHSRQCSVTSINLFVNKPTRVLHFYLH